MGRRSRDSGRSGVHIDLDRSHRPGSLSQVNRVALELSGLRCVRPYLSSDRHPLPVYLRIPHGRMRPLPGNIPGLPVRNLPFSLAGPSALKAAPSADIRYLHPAYRIGYGRQYAGSVADAFPDPVGLGDFLGPDPPLLSGPRPGGPPGKTHTNILLEMNLMKQ
jgi:hypothetical protein